MEMGVAIALHYSNRDMVAIAFSLISGPRVPAYNQQEIATKWAVSLFDGLAGCILYVQL